MKKVLIKTFSEKHMKMMTDQVIKYENGEVVFSNMKRDQPFVKRMIQEGIIGQYGKKYYPSDGLKFMKQLKYQFNGSRMLATDIIEDDEKILKEKDIEYSLPKEAEGINQVAKKFINEISEARNSLKALGILRSGRLIQADYSEWLVSKILNIQLSENPVEKSFDAVDENGKKFQIKSRIVKNLDDNTSFDFQRFGKFDYLVSVFFTPRYDLVGLLKVPISAVKALSNKNKRRYSFRINQKILSDERVEKLIWKKD